MWKGVGAKERQMYKVLMAWYCTLPPKHTFPTFHPPYASFSLPFTTFTQESCVFSHFDAIKATEADSNQPTFPTAFPRSSVQSMALGGSGVKEFAMAGAMEDTLAVGRTEG